MGRKTRPLRTLRSADAPRNPAPVRVLVVEPNELLAMSITQSLQERFMTIARVSDGETARRLLVPRHFDVVVLDLNIRGENGFTLLRQLAAKGRPVLVLSNSLDDADRTPSLESGAADYLAKPFKAADLAARLEAIRHAPLDRALERSRIAVFDDWRINLSHHTGRRMDGRELDLTTGELALLRAFLERPGRVMKRLELLSLTRHDDDEVLERTVDVLVTRLRKKLERDPRRPTFLRTIRGAGYRFDADVSWEDQGVR